MTGDRYDIQLDDKYGSLTLIDVAAEAVVLDPQQGYTVPRVVHKTSAPERTVILMVESAGVVPTGD